MSCIHSVAGGQSDQGYDSGGRMGGGEEQDGSPHMKERDIIPRESWLMFFL